MDFRPKVLVVGQDFDLCEAHIFSGLAENGVTVEVIMSPALNRKEILERAGIKVDALGISSRIDLMAMWQLRRRLLSDNYDIVHCLTSRALSNVLLASRNIKAKIVAYRGTMGHLSRFDPSSWLAYLNPKVNKIICVSNAVKDYILKFVPEERTMRIYKGHDVSWYDNHSELNLEEFGIPKGAFVVACTANMRPVKGVPYLIQAIETIPFEENVHLLLIGKVQDHEIEKLLLKPQRAERIHLAGFRKDATSVVSKCDVFVMPSVEREGLAKALMEAMSVGVAPIVSNVGGLPEVVLDGINGFVVPPRDSKSLADAISKLRHDESLRRQFVVAARKRVENDFNVQQTILETKELYFELCGRSSI